MSITITNIIPNVNQSVFYWLTSVTYSKGSTTGTLKTHFSDLNMKLGFPSALDALSLPTISLVQEPLPEQDDSIFGEYRKMLEFSFSIYGFCGSSEQDGDNKYNRDKLKNDIRFLLENSYFINVYDFPESGAPDFNTILTDMDISNIKCRNIPPTGPNKVDRYRFIVDFTVSYYWDRSLT